ncbi:hypothetical protein L7F22_028539 [Adiantum nelumboides]|nr:hypothetical protein [Adiantum nelumboides]
MWALLAAESVCCSHLDCQRVPRALTFLQHTHPSLPRYSDAEWEWLRGDLCTVDRDYGILNHVFHHITDTHVAHHIFSTMPHYHAGEATEAIKPILGKYYQFDGTPIAEALWREFKECVFVEADSPQNEGVFWYKSKVKSILRCPRLGLLIVCGNSSF